MSSLRTKRSKYFGRSPSRESGFHQTATRQIDAIIGYIAAQSPQGAFRVRERLQIATSLLAQHPYMGQATDLEGVRRIAVRPSPCLVFYRLIAGSVIVQRVRHAARHPSGAPNRA
ncbi:MAG TPA: type II toxin-antitoxin system RelE/ParE family toxin [Lichenihabitans sp.]|nr:type II toxin-antitoxin system RelE/ParE family toxin [Lichenihabitans sp.]